MLKAAITTVAALFLGQLSACQSGAEHATQKLSREDVELRDKLSAVDIGPWLGLASRPLPSFPPDDQSWSPVPQDRNVAIMGIPQKGEASGDEPRFFLYHPSGTTDFWIGRRSEQTGGLDWFGPAFFSREWGLTLTVGVPSCVTPRMLKQIERSERRPESAHE